MSVLSDVDVTDDSNEPRSQIVIIGWNKSSHQGDVTVGAYYGAQVYNLKRALASDLTGDVASSYGSGDGGAVALSTQSSKISKKRSTVAPPVVEDRDGPRHDDIDANAVVLSQLLTLLFQKYLVVKLWKCGIHKIER